MPKLYPKPQPKRPGRPPTIARDPSPVGQILRKIRGELSLVSAGERVGKSLDWWQARESGRSECSTADLELIGAAFEWGFSIRRGRTTARRLPATNQT